jgi:cytochrome P450
MSRMTSLDDLDLFSDEILADPYPCYAALREQAAAVYLPKTGVWAVTRYEAVRAALGNPQAFSSRAVAFNDVMNQALAGTSLAADPPDHRALRAALMENLTPRALRTLRDDVEAKADAMVAGLVERGTFDAIEDLAQALPVAVVMDLIGVQGEVRDKMLGWGFAAFNTLGPMNARTIANLPAAGELFDWVSGIKAADLAEGSIGRAVFAAAERGVIPAASCNGIIHQYVAAGLDSTIAGLGNAIALFAAHPDQYALIRADPSLIPAAFNEVLRYDAPVPLFGRLVTADTEVDGTVIPAGAQAALLFAAGNRDPRHYQDPDRFLVERNPVDHLGFGYGIHSCAGRGLASLEAQAVLGALARRVRGYTVGPGERRVGNSTRSLAKLPVTSLLPALPKPPTGPSQPIPRSAPAGTGEPSPVADGTELDSGTYYSVGGGFVVEEAARSLAEGRALVPDPLSVPFPFSTGAEVLAHAEVATASACGWAGFVCGPPVIGRLPAWASLPAALGLLPLLTAFVVVGTLRSRALRPGQPEPRPKSLVTTRSGLCCSNTARGLRLVNAAG